MSRIGQCSAVVSVVFLAAVLCATAFEAGAQEQPAHNITAAPGKDVRFGVYTDIRADCGSGPLPGVRLVTPPAHGTVTVKRGTTKEDFSVPVERKGQGQEQAQRQATH